MKYQIEKKQFIKLYQILKKGEILLVAGKGHEKIQIYQNKVRFFSDKEIILNSIRKKIEIFLKNLKLNIIREKAKSNLFFDNLKFKKAAINSKEVNKNDAFFCY